MPPKEKGRLAILFGQKIDIASFIWWKCHDVLPLSIINAAATRWHSIGLESAL